MRSCRESSSVASTVVWKSSRSSRLALATRRCASWSALRRSPPCAILPIASCACSSNFANASSVRRSSSLIFAVSRFSHSRAISFSRRSSSIVFSRSRISSACVSSIRWCNSARKRVTSRSRSLIESRARRMMSSGMPRRVAISSPADFPGSPSCSTYVGANVSSSNPIDPFTTPSVAAP